MGEGLTTVLFCFWFLFSKIAINALSKFFQLLLDSMIFSVFFNLVRLSNMFK